MEKKERNFLCVLTVHTRLSPVLLVEWWLRERAGKKFQLFLSFKSFLLASFLRTWANIPCCYSISSSYARKLVPF